MVEYSFQIKWSEALPGPRALVVGQPVTSEGPVIDPRCLHALDKLRGVELLLVLGAAVQAFQEANVGDRFEFVVVVLVLG